jgi:hypothetical protein
VAAGSGKVRFNDKIARTSDHHEMIDVVATNDEKLAPPVERKGLDYAKAFRIAMSPASCRHAKPAQKCAAKDQQEKMRPGEEGYCRDGICQRFALEKRITHGLHQGGSLGKMRNALS